MSSREETIQRKKLTSGSHLLSLWDKFFCGIRFYVKVDRQPHPDRPGETSILCPLYEGEFPSHRVIHVKDDGLYVDNILCGVWRSIDQDPHGIDILQL